MSIETRSAPLEMPVPLRPPRLDHGATGNGRIIALISPSSAIDWLCMPSFSSPSVFARLLDREKGGTFMVLGPDGQELSGDLAYIRNTNVLCTRFTRGEDVWDVVDFAPRVPEGIEMRAPIEIVR